MALYVNLPSHSSFIRRWFAKTDFPPSNHPRLGSPKRAQIAIAEGFNGDIQTISPDLILNPILVVWHIWKEVFGDPPPPLVIML
jgi:hypothetical protein